MQNKQTHKHDLKNTSCYANYDNGRKGEEGGWWIEKYYTFTYKYPTPEAHSWVHSEGAAYYEGKLEQDTHDTAYDGWE